MVARSGCRTHAIEVAPGYSHLQVGRKSSWNDKRKMPMVDDVPYLAPLTSRLPKNARQRTRILRAHRYAVENGDPTYLDPDTGLHVMTAVTLWENGTCCKSGCRHCPYHEGPRTGGPDGT